MTFALWLAIGIALGVGIGMMMDNPPLGIAIGAVLGAAIYGIERRWKTPSR